MGDENIQKFKMHEFDKGDVADAAKSEIIKAQLRQELVGYIENCEEALIVFRGPDGNIGAAIMADARNVVELYTNLQMALLDGGMRLKAEIEKRQKGD